MNFGGTLRALKKTDTIKGGSIKDLGDLMYCSAPGCKNPTGTTKDVPKELRTSYVPEIDTDLCQTCVREGSSRSSYTEFIKMRSERLKLLDY